MKKESEEEAEVDGFLFGRLRLDFVRRFTTL